jgi:hypothetical protein
VIAAWLVGKANLRAQMLDQMKDWLLHGAIQVDDGLALDLAGRGITSTGALCRAPDYAA